MDTARHGGSWELALFLRSKKAGVAFREVCKSQCPCPWAGQPCQGFRWLEGDRQVEPGQLSRYGLGHEDNDQPQAVELSVGWCAEPHVGAGDLERRGVVLVSVSKNISFSCCAKACDGPYHVICDRATLRKPPSLAHYH